MPGFAIDTGSDYSSGGEVGATTPDVEEEYDDGGSSGGGSVSTGGGTVVPESGVTPEENTGTIDLGETGDVEDTLYDDPQPAHESDLFNPDSGPSAGARIPDAATFPEVDDGLSVGFWDLVINEDGTVVHEESGTVGDILDGLDGDRAGVDDRALHTGDFDLGQYEPDWDGDGNPGGNLSDRDFDGDGNPGGNVIPDVDLPDIPDAPDIDPEVNFNIPQWAVLAGAAVVGLSIFAGTRSSA